MTFYSKDINKTIESLGPKEIEYLARIKIQEFFRQGFTSEEVKKEVGNLMKMEGQK